MKTFIIAAITADGFLGQDEHHLSTRWTTPADKAFFAATTKAAGVIIVGRTTFETFNRPLPGRRTIVLTHRPVTVEGVEATGETPAALIERLHREGHEKIAVCGGAQIYAQFLQAHVVDELYLTVHPTLFGKGIPLFRDAVHADLALLDMQNIGDDTVLLHYKVKT